MNFSLFPLCNNHFLFIFSDRSNILLCFSLETNSLNDTDSLFIILEWRCSKAVPTKYMKYNRIFILLSHFSSFLKNSKKFRNSLSKFFFQNKICFFYLSHLPSGEFSRNSPRSFFFIYFNQLSKFLFQVPKFFLWNIRLTHYDSLAEAITDFFE